MAFGPHSLDIPVTGRLELRDGVLYAYRTENGQDVPFGRVLVGPDGLTIDGMELPGDQAGDPWKIRGGSRGPGGGGALFSVNYIRSDGRGEEIGFFGFNLDDDVTIDANYNPSDLRGKAVLNIRPHKDTDSQPVTIWSQYRSQERFGFKTFYMAAVKMLGSLWIHTPSGGDATPYCGAVTGNSGGGSGSTGGRFYHEGGGYVTIYQNDGHVVTLKTYNTNDESKWEPVWSSWHGLLKSLPW